MSFGRDSCLLVSAQITVSTVVYFELHRKYQALIVKLTVFKIIPQREEEKSSEDNVYFGTVSDDSDIVTLEPPKLEEIGNPEALIVEEAHSPEDFNMGSSSSSQYTFCQPETGKSYVKNTLIETSGLL